MAPLPRESVPGAMKDPEEFWKDLLAFIKAGRVIPVIGDLAVTFDANDALHSSHLAAALAGKGHLNLDPTRLPDVPSLTDVACEWLADGNKSSELYKHCYLASQEFERDGHLPGKALLALASIRNFNLFLTTTFDSLLARAIETQRGQAPDVRGFFPNKEPDAKDLPAKRAQLSQTTVYHLFGQRSLFEGEYVLWEQDALEFLCALHTTLKSGKGLDLLSRELADNALLIVGLNFSDLLVRLFLRVAKQRSLAELSHDEILAEETPGLGQRGNVLLFGGVMRNVYIWRQDPVAFSLELAKRWHIDNPAPAAAAAKTAASNAVPQGAIFISYAREDEAAALKLSEALKGHGCVVWYDRERLKAGAYWPEALRDAVAQHCAVFVAIVSDTTEDAVEGYWRHERLWAIHRAAGFYPDEFYIPLWIGTREPPFKSEPALVREGINAIALPADGTAEFQSFVERVRALQVRRTGALR